MNTTFGYVRISTSAQNEERQLFAMETYGVSPENIFVDKQSGKDFARPAFRAMVKRLSPGNTLVIKSIDRLGRDYDETIDQWRYLTREKEVNIVVLDMPFLNDLQKCELVGRLIADIILYIMCYFAQTEREKILERQAEGFAVAKRNGVKIGRRAKEKPPEFAAVCKKWRRGEISAATAGKLLGVSRNTFLKWVRK